MGRQSRKKRENRQRATDHRQAFQAAMLEEHIREMAARDTVCIVCERPDPAYVGVWFVAPDLGRSLGVPDGKTRVYLYRLCEHCGPPSPPGDARMAPFVEAAIIARERGEGFVALDSHGMPVLDTDGPPLPAARPL